MLATEGKGKADKKVMRRGEWRTVSRETLGAIQQTIQKTPSPTIHYWRSAEKKYPLLLDSHIP